MKQKKCEFTEEKEEKLARTHNTLLSLKYIFYCLMDLAGIVLVVVLTFYGIDGDKWQGTVLATMMVVCGFFLGLWCLIYLLEEYNKNKMR